MAEKRELQMKEITEQLEQGVKELFTSEMYTEYLRTMSQFHNYSFNNTLLIAMQKPDATLVAGYQAWQKKFKRQVRRGEKAIQIIAPAPIREKQEVEKIDPETQEPVLRFDGQPETEEVEIVIPRFRVASVFDISQTDGEPLPELETPELMGSVENFKVFMKAVQEVSPVPVRFDEISSGAKGYYSNTEKEIVIQNGMSESQTMKTGIHEVTHAMLHDRDFMEEQGEKKNQMTKEVEAESVAYTVCQYFGLDTSDYSFPYIAGWSSSMDMKELRTSMDTIRKTAGSFIDSMTEVIQRFMREQPELSLSAMKQAEILIDRVEQERTLFSGEERNLLVNYAYKFDNAEETEKLIRKLAEAKAIPDLRSATEICRDIQKEIEFLPDGMVGMTELHRYGYQNEGMLPVERERAHELFQEGFEIFALYPDDTEAMLDDEGELDTHDGLFGIEKAVWEKYHRREAVREESGMPEKEQKYQEVELFDVPALFINERVAGEAVPEGLHRYELRGADYDPGYPLTIEKQVMVNHAATILTAVPLSLPEQGYFRLGDELNFTGEMVTLAEYQEKMNAIDLNIEQEKMENAIGRANENLYLSGKEERYAIYQLGDSEKGRDYRFMGMDFVTAHNLKINAEDYRLVYGGKLSEGETLEGLYERFNINHPAGYEGHSLSVSDVVVLTNGGSAKAYYVDSMGFAELPDFILQRQHEVKMNHKREDSAVTLDTSGIEIEQHDGLWHTADVREIKDEIFYLMKNNEYGDSVAAVIVNADGELVAQELENGFDKGAMEAIQEYLAEKGMTWEPEHPESEQGTSLEKNYPPVYPHTLSYAMEHGAADDYLDSRKLNLDCKNAIEEAIKENFDGMHLAQETAEKVLEAYGAERISFVLANTIQKHSYDGRYSRDNKAWAETIQIPENVSRGTDLNADYIVNSHPAVLDGFVNLFRKAGQEMNHEQEMGQNDIWNLSGQETELAYQAEDRFLFIQDTEGGYDYTFYGMDYREIDGGIYEDSDDMTIEEAAGDLLAEEGYALEDCTRIDCEELQEKTEKAAQEEIEEARHSLSASDGKEPEPKISFYVAECTEFHILGEYHEDLSLQEAAELYQTIPADRMNGIKGIGFRLEDGSIYDGTYELMTAGKMQTEFINEIPHYRDSPLVQQAIVDMEKILDKWKEKELTEPEKEKPLEPEKTAEKAPKADIQTAKGKGKKQSVLQALRERQAKLKAQETGQTEQKTQGRRKGEPEL